MGLNKRDRNVRDLFFHVLTDTVPTLPPTKFVVMVCGNHAAAYWKQGSELKVSENLNSVDEYKRFIKARAAEAQEKVWSLDIRHYITLRDALKFERADWQFARDIEGAF